MSDKILLQKINLLKEQLSNLLHDWYCLQTQELSRISLLYENVFGNIEEEIAKKEEKASSLELKYTLLQSYCSEDRSTISKQTLDFVEDLVSKSHKRNTEKLQKQVIKNQPVGLPPLDSPLDTTSNDAIDSLSIYRQIVKKIHPDIVGSNAKLRVYWDSVQFCYNNNNSKQLQMFYKILCFNYVESNSLTKQELQMAHDELNEYIDLQINENKILQTQVPFCFDKKLNDNKWILEHKNELRNKLVQANKRIMEAEDLLKQIIYTK